MHPTPARARIVTQAQAQAQALAWTGDPVRRRWLAVVAVAAALYAVVMGLSRVYLGAHWLSDVMAGWAVGLAWALAVVLAHRVWLTLRRR